MRVGECVPVFECERVAVGVRDLVGDRVGVFEGVFVRVGEREGVPVLLIVMGAVGGALGLAVLVPLAVGGGVALIVELSDAEPEPVPEFVTADVPDGDCAPVTLPVTLGSIDGLTLGRLVFEPVPLRVRELLRVGLAVRLLLSVLDCVSDMLPEPLPLDVRDALGVPVCEDVRLALDVREPLGVGEELLVPLGDAVVDRDIERVSVALRVEVRVYDEDRVSLDEEDALIDAVEEGEADEEGVGVWLDVAVFDGVGVEVVVGLYHT